jgi:predicted TIM-barrel fold metal-dependent hydrolase
MLDAMREVTARFGLICRGIVDVDENISDTEIEHLDVVGVRGVRINVRPIKPREEGFAAKLLPRIERLDARCAEIGWVLDFLLPGWLTGELIDTFYKLKANFAIAHMGMFLAADGLRQTGFQQLLKLLRHGTGRCWIKLTGPYRLSSRPGYADTIPMARALIEAAPNHVIWGSDYPHLSFADHAHTVELFNLLAQWAPDEETRRKILVDNPQELFKF